MCSAKTMIQIALGIGLLLAIGYLAFPQVQGAIVALSPYFLILACPLAMYLGMRGMRKSENEKKSAEHQKMSERYHK